MSAWFIVRVELHKSPSGPSPTREDYDILHSKMETNYFTRTITGNNGIEYYLPPAEYFFDGRDNLTAVELRDLVKLILKNMKYSHSIMVMHAPSIAWTGLTRVTKASRVLPRI
jgi:hypothetical protein